MSSKSFYKNAEAYDIAFSDRDFDIECNFLEWCLSEHSKLTKSKLKSKSFLEMGCGPAHHVREFSQRGWRSIALDLSPEMINYAKQISDIEKIKIETKVADMCDFKLKEPVVLAATLMESISHLTTNEQMIKHFKTVAKNLVPGGIYVIEATHPMFFFPDKEANTWSSRKNGKKVEITFGLPNDKYNSISQVWDITTKILMFDKGKLTHSSSSKTPVRWYLAQELMALIELSGVFDEFWMYGSLYFIPGKELDESDNSDGMIIVLRTKK